MSMNCGDPTGCGGDLPACRELLYGGSKSFHAASLLLPATLRDPATALYAFCRVADDAIDGAGDSTAALEWIRRRLDLIYSGRPEDRAADRAFAAVVERHDIPRALPEALLEGFAWDAEGRRYATIQDLQCYAARVAGSVGVMMSLLMGQRDPRVLARASELGVAMQLTNIARDVGEDARAGRLYVPGDWLREAGIEAEAWLERPRFDARWQQPLERLLQQADLLYARAAEGIAWLPWRCRAGMHAARLLYAQIGAAVRENGCDSISVRARVSLGRKLALLPEALASALQWRGALTGQLVETRFLVDAVIAHRAPSVPLKAPPVPSRAEWLLQLFERLEREQLATRGSD
ncbi:MAG TPA: phytoene/squalene synthase family protein [Steroidobacteraceae bacterium]|nr:phytoene/squalene synthase family protein [Steroidobacteraceae bacterium]